MASSDPQKSQLCLTRLPAEILHNILFFVEPRDLARVARTSKYLQGYVTNNTPLCREIYLCIFDDPNQSAADVGDVDWQKELRDYVKLTRICSDAWTDKTSELPFVHDTVVRILKRAAGPQNGQLRRVSNAITHKASRNASLLADLFSEDDTKRSLLCQSFLWQRARGKAKFLEQPPRAEQQMSARLHCLYGAPLVGTDMVFAEPAAVEEGVNGAGASGGRRNKVASENEPHMLAISKVYDLREFLSRQLWGPFLADGSGRVDWERLEAILMVLKHGIGKMGLGSGNALFASCWSRPFAGCWAGSYVPMPTERCVDDLERADPFGVSGTYLRVIAFLDYADFFDFNFHNNYQQGTGEHVEPNMPRPVWPMGEAARLMLIKIHVTDVQGSGDNVVVHFKGFSELLHGFGSHNVSSKVKGSVRLTPDGEVRWTTVSVFGGLERWSGEGIQIGGPRSAKCVVGNWFDVNHDPAGPVGPSAFWKITDREPGSVIDRFSAADILPWFHPDGDGVLFEEGETETLHGPEYNSSWSPDEEE